MVVQSAPLLLFIESSVYGQSGGVSQQLFVVLLADNRVVELAILQVILVTICSNGLKFLEDPAQLEALVVLAEVLEATLFSSDYFNNATIFDRLPTLRAVLHPHEIALSKDIPQLLIINVVFH